MNWLCKLALIAIPYNLISIAWIQLDLIHQGCSKQIDDNFGNTSLFIIAHPDDETMFFGPTILNLLEKGRHIHILCLSHGDADNYGDRRRKELATVVEAFGPNASMEIIDDTRLMDGLANEWDNEVVFSYINNSFHNLQEVGLANLVTFDSYGISGHSNHRAIHEAVIKFKNMHDLPRVRFHTLKSVNIYRKYISFLDAMITYPPVLKTTFRSQPYFVGDQSHIIIALSFEQNAKLRGLLNMHESQMIWFRKLYMFFSRYMFLNNLSLIE